MTEGNWEERLCGSIGPLHNLRNPQQTSHRDLLFKTKRDLQMSSVSEIDSGVAFVAPELASVCFRFVSGTKGCDGIKHCLGV